MISTELSFRAAPARQRGLVPSRDASPAGQGTATWYAPPDAHAPPMSITARMPSQRAVMDAASAERPVLLGYLTGGPLAIKVAVRQTAMARSRRTRSHKSAA